MIVLFIVSVGFDTWRNDWKLSGTLQNCNRETPRWRNLLLVFLRDLC